jgi:hypothetical protein
MKIKDITRLREDDDIKIEPSPDSAKATGPDGTVIATGPTAALQAAADAGVDFTPTDQQTSEGAMSEIHQELSSIVANEDFDALYELFSANTPTGRYVQAMAEDVMIDHGLHPDDDFERIEEIVFDRLEDEFGGEEVDEEVGGDGTGTFINAVRDAEAETAMGYGPQDGEEPLDEFLGFGNKTPEEWAKTSPQMAKLLQFRAKAVGTPYAAQVEKRIQLLKDRLDLDAGEVAGPGGIPKDPVPPEQFDMKQLREADDDLLNKMRAIAGLR